MHHVFVDFENVPSVDLSGMRDQDASVTLLIGEKQRRLELGLVQQIHEHATKVTLVEVGASGRNALDLVLAWHLGKTAERHSSDSFFVVSKDKDFDPLIAHLRARNLRIERVPDFDALPFLAARPPAKKAISTRAPRRMPAPAAQRAPVAPSGAAVAPLAPTPPSAHGDELDGRFAKLIDRLEHKTKARPVRRKTLLSHINGFYGNQLSELQLDALVARLEQRGVIALDEKGRVSYP